MYSQQNVGIGDDYVTAHRLDRRLAVIDRFYLTNVTNRAFNDYFGIRHMAVLRSSYIQMIKRS